MAADDAVAAEKVHVAVEEVHRAAFALRAAVDAAEQLGHHRARRNAPRDRLSMFAVARDHIVVVAERGDGADTDAFLADVQVTKAADLADGVRFRAALFEATDEEHLPQQVAPQCRIAPRGRVDGARPVLLGAFLLWHVSRRGIRWGVTRCARRRSPARTAHVSHGLTRFAACTCSQA